MKKQSTLEIKTTGKLFPIISLLITNSLAIFGILFLNWSGSLILFYTNFLINTLIFTTFLFISHQISYKKNFIGGKEYKNLAVSRALITPYRRVIPVHIAIMFGAISGIPGIILVSLKTIIDLLTHYMEHKSKS
jgi:hypothetical protein